MTPELLALLRELPTPVLDRLRRDVIPSLLRERVAPARLAELAAHADDYLAQAKAKG